MWKHATRDPLIFVYAALAVSLWVPALAFQWTWVERYDVAYLLHAAAIGMGILACVRSRTDSPPERRFYGLIALSLLSWLGCLGLRYAIDARWQEHPGISLLGDCTYGLVYLFLLLAIELRPHAHDASDRRAGWRPPALVGSTLFVATLFAYFVLISWKLDPASYWTWVPSGSFYLLMDLSIGLRLASLMLSVEDPCWRARYGWLSATIAVWIGLDGISLLEYSNSLANALPNRVVDALWFLTPLGMAISARIRRREQAGLSSRPAGRDLVHSLWGGSPLASVLQILCLHAGIELLTTQSPQVGTARELLALAATMGLIFLSLASQRRLQVANQRLESERETIAAHAQAAERAGSLGKLAVAATHELNNQLQVVRAYGEELLHNAGDRTDLQSDARALLAAAARSTELTSDLLRRSQSKRESPVRLDLNESVTQIVALLRRTIGGHITIELRLAAGSAPVVTSRGALEQAMINLAMNAKDAMPRGGTLLFETATDSTGVRLLVRDDGLGMVPATLERIFEPFFTTKPEGTGLGLAIVREYVEEAGGSIEVQSEPGRGTSFTLRLPLPREAREPSWVGHVPAHRLGPGRPPLR